uniref:Coiled-coil domain-containing protein 105 n=1 Tax=Knipowitschia caucasica TaxID=637954 RepID=A0AAV2MFH7_KNICA
MRAVQEVEANLRRRASRVAQEGVRLHRDQELMEATLRSLQSGLMLNQANSRQRTKRPEGAETVSTEDQDTQGTKTVCDGADLLLGSERRELQQLKQELEETLRHTRTHIQSLSSCCARLVACASERARVLDLLAPSVCRRVPGRPAPKWTKADPTSPYTPECKEAADRSSSAVLESQHLRTSIRQQLHHALLRQRAAQQAVNDGLLKKVAETVTLQQSLSVMCGATRQATFRKRREKALILHSHGRTQGPEYSGDVLSRERLDRPLVQVYHRHPGTQLPEAAQLNQGSVLLSRLASSCQAQESRLQRSCHLLQSDLQRKSSAAAVDSAVLRMRRRHLEQRSVPVSLLQDALQSQKCM